MPWPVITMGVLPESHATPSQKKTLRKREMPAIRCQGPVRAQSTNDDDVLSFIRIFMTMILKFKIIIKYFYSCILFNSNVTNVIIYVNISDISHISFHSIIVIFINRLISSYSFSYLPSCSNVRLLAIT